MQTLGKDDATVMSADRQRPIRRFLWGQDSRTLLFLQDVKGNEDWHVYRVDCPYTGPRPHTCTERAISPTRRFTQRRQ